MTARALVLVPLVVLATGCGGANGDGRGTATSGDPCAGRQEHGFALSLPSSRGGAATPTDAAEQQSGRDGWSTVHQDAHGTTVAAPQATRHVLRGSDGTWFVDSGVDC